MLQLAQPFQKPTNEDWRGKGTKPKTSAITQAQALTTELAGHIQNLMSNSSDETISLASAKDIVNGRTRPPLEISRASLKWA